MEKVIEQLTTFATDYGLKIIGAIIILIVGRIAAGIVRGILRRMLNRTKVDATIVSFFGTMAYFLVLV